MRGCLVRQWPDARLANLREAKRAIRHPRGARPRQRGVNGADEFVERERGALRHGNHRDGPGREGSLIERGAYLPTLVHAQPGVVGVRAGDARGGEQAVGSLFVQLAAAV